MVWTISKRDAGVTALSAHHLPVNCVEVREPVNDLALRRTPQEVLREQFVVDVGLTGFALALQGV